MENRGGVRKNAGRKKSNYKTKVITFRVKLELVESIKKIVKEFINFNNK